MPEQINQHERDRLLIALTDGIGAELGRTVRFSYYELVKRLGNHERFQHLPPESRQEIVDILALSMFYKTVVSPLEGGRSLLSLARKADANHIRIGGDKLTQTHAGRFGACVSAFNLILKSQRIPPRVLSFATLEEFITNVLSAKELAHRETMD